MAARCASAAWRARKAGQHSSVRGARRDGVHANSRLGEFERHRLGDAFDGVFTALAATAPAWLLALGTNGSGVNVYDATVAAQIGWWFLNDDQQTVDQAPWYEPTWPEWERVLLAFGGVHLRLRLLLLLGLSLQVDDRD